MRYPEERYVRSGVIAGIPAIRVPADSRLEYSIDVPPDARFRTGFVGEGEGELQASVGVGTETVWSEKISPVNDPEKGHINWIELDLAPWAGDPITLILETEGERSELNGWWVMPQIESSSEWVLSDPSSREIGFESASYRFDDQVELVGYRVLPPSLAAGEIAQVQLYWRPLQEVDSYGKVFVHLIDEQGRLVAQDDSQPVDNSYPIPLWQPGTIIVDAHTLRLPSELADGVYTLAIGLYDPKSLQRWTVREQGGQIAADGRAILTTAIEVSP